MALSLGLGLLLSNEGIFNQQKHDQDHPNKVLIPQNPEDHSVINNILSLEISKDENGEVIISSPDNNSTTNAKTA